MSQPELNIIIYFLVMYLIYSIPDGKSTKPKPKRNKAVPPPARRKTPELMGSLHSPCLQREQHN